MEDIILQANIDENTTVYVSPLARQTYAEYAGEGALGGGEGYFVTRASGRGADRSFEILAKALSVEAAGDLFDMIVGNRRPIHV
jgi:hypothetical protein